MVHLPVLPGEGSQSASQGELARALGAASCGELRFGRHDRLLYATDASNYQVEPIGVVIPRSVDEAVRAVGVCAERGAAILARGGGTSLAGQCTGEAVVIDFSPHVNRLISVDAARRSCIVEPGITIEDLNALLAGSGLGFAPDPATARHANIGGCIGNNAAGARSVRYGRTSENLLGVDALLLGTDGDVPPRRAWLREGSAARDESVRDLTQRVINVVRPCAGAIRERFPKTIRRNAGYSLDLVLDQIERADGAGCDPLETVNLASLLCGSEGTLAVTLGAELALRDIPRHKGLATLGFDSLEAAIEAVAPILQTGPVAVELLDDMVLDVARANIEYRRYVELMPRPGGQAPRAVLYVEYFSELPGDPGRQEITESLIRLRSVIPGAAINIHTEPADMARIWKLRRAGEPLLHGVAADRKPISFVEDNAVPVERLAEFVRRFKEIVTRHGTVAAYWAHASVGVLHVRPLLNLRDADDERRMQEIAIEVADLARELGGVMSGEHGDGRVRSPLLERFYGPELMRAFRDIKRLFDPRGLLNPGNIVGAEAPARIESIAERTRVRPHDRIVDAAPVETFFEYTDQHGLRGAVEMCNGAGVCRKKSGGVMCPSYMGTLDERHSTRGRGNALRLAITGQSVGGDGVDRLSEPIPRQDGRSTDASSGSHDGRPTVGLESRRTQEGRPIPWNDPETLATLDLCLSCKACKAECPSNVDIARLKAEYLAQGYRDRGKAPPAARIIGNIRRLNRLGAITPRLSNLLANSPLGRFALGRLIDLDPRRSLPPLRRSLKRQWGGGPSGASAGGEGLQPADFAAELPQDAPSVALFADCFTMYNEPHIGIAAKRVLEAFGYRVRLIDAGCCARSMISVGLLEQALPTIDATAARLVAELAPGEPLLVLEPSCLSAITDDWPQLKVRTARALRDDLAGRARLVEQFLEERWDQHPRRPEFGGAPSGGPGAEPQGAKHGQDARATGEHGLEARATEARATLHAHCHQKSLWGADSSAAILRRILGDRLTVPDTTCCGMAGAFGYTRKRFDLSMKIGALSVFPAVRAAAPDEAILAPGTSCRHQIYDGTQRLAQHPIEFLDQLLASDHIREPASASSRPRAPAGK